MSDHTWSDRLSQMATSWTILYQAHEGTPQQMQAARQRLLERYHPVVRRYLLGAVRDPHVADDLCQEFALRFVRGAFHNANPEKGRFRDFLKTSLFRLVVDHQRRQKQHQRVGQFPEMGFEPADDSDPVPEPDEEFVAMWREELLARTFAALEEWDRQAGQHLYTVLRYRMDHPDVRSPQMAEQLAPVVGKPLTSMWVRKRLHLAREKFGELLLAEVRQSLEMPTQEDVEQELLDVGLLEYCKSALEKQDGS